MTIEDRYVIEISDLAAVRMDCQQCGTSISFKVAEWKTVPEDCPGCRTTWHRGSGTEEHRILNGLGNVLRAATDLMSTQRSQPVQFRVRFELERLKL